MHVYFKLKVIYVILIKMNQLKIIDVNHLQVNKLDVLQILQLILMFVCKYHKHVYLIWIH